MTSNSFSSTPVGSLEPSSYYSGVSADPIQKDLYRQQALAQIEASKAEQKSQIRCREQEHHESVKNAGEETRAMTRADVDRRKRLLRTWVRIEKDGSAEIVTEMFGTPHKGVTEYKVVGAAILYCEETMEENILYMLIEHKKGFQTAVYVKTTEITEKNINQKFNSVGIRFGFGREKETFIRMLFVNTLVENAQFFRIPPCRGWYLEGENMKFAFPGEGVTFREAKENA